MTPPPACSVLLPALDGRGHLLLEEREELPRLGEPGPRRGVRADRRDALGQRAGPAAQVVVAANARHVPDVVADAVMVLARARDALAVDPLRLREDADRAGDRARAAVQPLGELRGGEP